MATIQDIPSGEALATSRPKIVSNFNALNTELAQKETPTGAQAKADAAQAAAVQRANHTGTQPATTIVQDSTHRFVSDAEKTAWNAGGGAGVDQTARDAAASALSLANTADTRAMSAVSGAQSAQTTADNAYTVAMAAETPSGAQTKANAAQAAAVQRANHTGTQAASTIVQDATHRFVSDSEKATWNSAAGGGLANPMTTAGDLIVGGASGTPARLGIGSEGQTPIVRSGALVYETPAAGGGGGANFGIFQYASNIKLQFAGDSLTAAKAGGWVEKLLETPWLASRVSTTNNSAASGRTMAGVVTAYPTSDYPNRTGGNQSWYFLWVGANNIAGASPDTGAFLTAWIAHLQQLRTDGWSKIVAFTIMRRSDGGNAAPTEAARQILNNVIRRRSDLWDYLVEPDVLFPDETNTTWFDGGLVHLSSEGYARLAKHVAWVLSSGGAPNPTSGAFLTGPLANAQMANAPAHTIKGNNTAAAAAPVDLTAAQVAAELPAVVGDTGSGGTKGLVPAPAAGDANAGRFLKADGTWAVPPAASGMANPMTTAGDLVVAGAGGTPSRLAAGSNGQALQIVGGVPQWAANSAGFTNPMTTAGDIIVGGSGGAAQRMALGPMLSSFGSHPNGTPTWLSDRNVAVVQDDFLVQQWVFAATGTGTSASAAGDNTAPGCGVVRLKTGTTATGFAIVHGGTTGFAQYRMATTPTFYRAYVRIPTLSDATEQFRVSAGVAAGYGSNVNTIDHIGFSYIETEDGGNWRLTCRSGSSESTVNGVPMVADTNYRLEWYFDGTQVTGWVNGVNIGTISTNIPAGPFGPICAIGKLAGGTLQSSVYLDYMGLFALPNR